MSDNYKRFSLEKINEFIKNKGICLSNEYLNNKSKLLFKCKFAHEWFATWSNIKKGKWCPYCKTLSGETITRSYFEAAFNEKFPKCKPDWLIGPKNYKLELDGFCEKLKIAFEHQGLQHYEINQFSKNLEGLKKIQLHDKIKKDLCIKNNINLIIIPQISKLTSIENLKDIIYNIFNIKMDTININHQPKDYLNKYKEIAISKGGSCISLNYINSSIKLEFKCKNNHIWKSLPFNISKGSWCPQCSYDHKKINFKNQYTNILAHNL